ncbi:LysR family transcriptional regulator [uncultured Ferrimonas sp.]|uniref:LysR family transcriptional regulator n=1 Tax=uncultured Ferrimonas sp. TaxID=432640 RepID=UPI0026223909|nr:LysR family transcriptional regulator [uncultured Ferrimonas sp.]
MDKLTSMQVFVKVAELRHFAKAAVLFNISATMVGKHIKSLEAQLGTTLIQRTTRKQLLTEAGQFYYRECVALLAQLRQSEQQLQRITHSPRGVVRLNAPLTYGNLVLAPLLGKFLARYPDIDVELQLDNRRIAIDEQVDALIRIGELGETTLVARQLGHYPLRYCAAPSYLAKHGTPHTPAELSGHHCLGFDGGSGQKLLPKPRLVSNSGALLQQAAIDGGGILLQPTILLQAALERGDLVPILPDATPAPMPVQLLYQSGEQPLKNRALIEFLLAELRENS